MTSITTWATVFGKISFTIGVLREIVWTSLACSILKICLKSWQCQQKALIRKICPSSPILSISLIIAVFARIRENEELRQSWPVAFSAVDGESHAGWEEAFRGICSGTIEGHALWTGFCSSRKKQGIWDTGPQNRHPFLFLSLSTCPLEMCHVFSLASLSSCLKKYFQKLIKYEKNPQVIVNDFCQVLFCISLRTL